MTAPPNFVVLDATLPDVARLVKPCSVSVTANWGRISV